MEAIGSIRAQLEKADSPVAALSAAGEAFRLVCQIADEYAVPGSQSYATWTWGNRTSVRRPGGPRS